LVEHPPPHYFDANPAVASKPRTVSLVLSDGTLELLTDRGVFAGAGVDPGTKLLLLDGPQPPVGPVDLLDIGCGYGPIAIVLARRSPEATVWAVDVNERAVALCTANAAAAGVGERVRAVSPDAVPDAVAFAGIWSNPPIRVGKAALHGLLRRWLARLDADGTAHLVVQKHLGADSLARWLAAEGWTVERRRSRMGYRLLDVARPSPP
jgi:16S rRNA (guanine1207-N2)-methyltransferase